MYTTQNTVKISDLRKHTSEVISEIEKSEEPIMIFSRSQPKVVMMSFHWYQKTRPGKTRVEKTQEKHGIDFFIDPPEEFLIKKRGLDVVKEIRKLRD